MSSSIPAGAPAAGGPSPGVLTVPIVTPVEGAPAPQIPRRGRAPRAAAADMAGAAVATNGSRRAPRRKADGDAVGDGARADVAGAGEAASTDAPRRARRTSGGPRKRESGVQGLAGRARLEPDRQTLYALPDALFSALPALRQAILNRPLDEALRVVAEGLALALSPAVARIWIAGAAPWGEGAGRIGGSELLPALRLRAQAGSLARDPSRGPSRPADDGEGHGDGRRDPSPAGDDLADPLIADVAAARRPAVLFDAVGHPLARAWAEGPDAAPPALGTLAAFPLRARARFLGVLAVGAAGRLGTRQLAALEELADLAALAADRDRLLGHSRGPEALALAVVRHAPVAMALIAGPDYTLALANPAFAALLGVEADTPLVGRRLGDVVGERAKGLAAGLRLAAAYAGEEPQAMVELPLHREERMTYWNVTTSPLAGAVADGQGAGDAVGALVAGVEVTRQVLARQRAQESASVADVRVRQMMSLHATSLAVASQLGADPRELLDDLLRRSIVLLGARAGAIYVRDARRDALEVTVCQGLRRDYTGDRIRGGEGIAGQVARTGRGLIVDDYRAYPYRAAIYDGEDVTAAIAVPLIHAGRVVGVLDVLDEAERRTFTEDDLRLLELFAAQAAQAIQNARMYVELERALRKQRELDRMKDDFIATASHELRTPLTGVQGFLELLLDLPTAKADPMVGTFARKAHAAAEDLAEISERLLQTSRLDSGRVDLYTTPVALAPLAQDVLRAFGELQATRDVRHGLVCEVPPRATVAADYGRLKEILNNLVGNAIKYSPRGGRIVVGCGPLAPGVAPADGACEEESPEESPTVELAPLSREEAAANGAPGDAGASASHPAPALLVAARHRPYALLTVRDEGMGIAPGERPRLFGRFSRLEAARVGQIRGTGLGLYICRQLARAMGGDVWLLESAPGRGSTFAVALPAVAAEPAGEGPLVVPALTPRPAVAQGHQG